MALSRPHVGLVLLLASCAKKAEDIGSPPLDSTGDTGSELQPWTAEEIGASLDALFSAGLPTGTVLWRQTTDLLASGDEACPGAATGLAWPPSGCEAETGYAYAGVLQMSVATYTESGAEIEERAARLADLRFDRPDGTAFLSAGYFFASARTAADTLELVSVVRGTWQDDGSALGWLQAGTSADQQAHVAWDASGVEISVKGSFGGPLGAAVVEEELVVDSAVCALAPTQGAALVRTPEARWLRVRWSGDCDPCQQVLLEDDRVLGVACLGLGERLLAEAARMKEAW